MALWLYVQSCNCSLNRPGPATNPAHTDTEQPVLHSVYSPPVFIWSDFNLSGICQKKLKAKFLQTSTEEQQREYRFAASIGHAQPERRGLSTGCSNPSRKPSASWRVGAATVGSIWSVCSWTASFSRSIKTTELHISPRKTALFWFAWFIIH